MPPSTQPASEAATDEAQVADEAAATAVAEDTLLAHTDDTAQALSPPSALESRPMSPLVLVLTILTSICGFLFGYDTGYISGALVVIRSDLGRPLSPSDKELITSATSLGALLMAVVGGALADRFGRKHVVTVANVLFVVGALFQVFAHSMNAMVTGRFVMGWGVGLASLVAPLYIAEMAPSRYRGRLVVVNVLAITGGQLVAYGVSAALHQSPIGWRLMVGLGIIPAVLQLVVFIFMPETPRYLVRMGRIEEARRVLQRTYSKEGDEEEVDVKLAEIVKYNTDSQSRQGLVKQWISSYVEVHTVPSNLRAVIITCGLQAIQQLSGFNALMYFSATIFESVGFDNPTTVSLIVAGTNFVFTIVALLTIDWVGRRRILLWTVWGMVGGLLLSGLAFAHLDISLDDHTKATQLAHNPWNVVVLVAMLVYVASYATGIGNVPWQQSELFPMRVRGAGTSLATSVNWAGSLLISSCFLSLMQSISPTGTFVLFAAICLAGELFVYKVYPETAGLALEEVQDLLKGGFNIEESLKWGKERSGYTSRSSNHGYKRLLTASTGAV